MRLSDFQLIQSLKKRLNWAADKARPNFLPNLLMGRETDFWSFEPNTEVWLKYDSILKKFVLYGRLDGINFQMPVESESLLNLMVD